MVAIPVPQAATPANEPNSTSPAASSTCDAAAVAPPAAAPAPSRVSARLDWSDAPAVEAWLACLRQSFADADAVTLDMLRPPDERELGPALHVKNYGEAHAQILAALDYAGAPEADGDEEGGAA